LYLAGRAHRDRLGSPAADGWLKLPRQRIEQRMASITTSQSR